MSSPTSKTMPASSESMTEFARNVSRAAQSMRDAKIELDLSVETGAEGKKATPAQQKKIALELVKAWSPRALELIEQIERKEELPESWWDQAMSHWNDYASAEDETLSQEKREAGARLLERIGQHQAPLPAPTRYRRARYGKENASGKLDGKKELAQALIEWLEDEDFNDGAQSSLRAGWFIKRHQQKAFDMRSALNRWEKKCVERDTDGWIDPESLDRIEKELGWSPSEAWWVSLSEGLADWDYDQEAAPLLEKMIEKRVDQWKPETVRACGQALMSRAIEGDDASMLARSARWAGSRKLEGEAMRMFIANWPDAIEARAEKISKEIGGLPLLWAAMGESMIWNAPSGEKPMVKKGECLQALLADEESVQLAKDNAAPETLLNLNWKLAQALARKLGDWVDQPASDGTTLAHVWAALSDASRAKARMEELARSAPELLMASNRKGETPLGLVTKRWGQQAWVKKLEQTLVKKEARELRAESARPKARRSKSGAPKSRRL